MVDRKQKTQRKSLSCFHWVVIGILGIGYHFARHFRNLSSRFNKHSYAASSEGPWLS